MPNAASVKECGEAYMLSWKLGLKANALYRDGSKLSQPLATTAFAFEDAMDDDEVEAPRPAVQAPVQTMVTERIVEKVIEKIRARERKSCPIAARATPRRRLWADTKSISTPANMRMAAWARSSSTCTRKAPPFRSLMNNFAIAISVGLQYGVPLEEFVEAFTFTRFEPAGLVIGNDSIKNATSVLDYIFRELGVSYLGRTDLAHVVPAADEDIGDGVGGGSPTEVAIAKVASTGYLRGHLKQMAVVKGGAAPACWRMRNSSTSRRAISRPKRRWWTFPRFAPASKPRSSPTLSATRSARRSLRWKPRSRPNRLRGRPMPGASPRRA